MGPDVLRGERLELALHERERRSLVLQEALPRRRFFVLPHAERVGHRAADEEVQVGAAEKHLQEQKRSFVGEVQVVHEKHQGLAVEEHGREFRESDENSLAATTLVFFDRGRAVVEVGKHVSQVVELSRVERVEGRDPFVRALAHERHDGLTGEVVGTKSLLPPPGKLHHGKRLISGEAPADGLDDRRLSHARGALDEEESRLAQTEGFERFGERLELAAAAGDFRVVEPVKRDLGRGLVRIGFLRYRNPVAALLLGNVESGVRLANEIVSARGVGARGGDSDAERDVNLTLPAGERERSLLGELDEGDGPGPPPSRARCAEGAR